MGILIKIVITAAALWVAVQIVPGFDFEGSIWALLGVALILGIVNVVVKPILTILSLPAVVLTLGLFLLVVNAITLAIAVWLSGTLDLGLTSSDFFWSTFLAALVVSLVSWALETITGTGD